MSENKEEKIDVRPLTPFTYYADIHFSASKADLELIDKGHEFEIVYERKKPEPEPTAEEIIKREKERILLRNHDPRAPLVLESSLVMQLINANTDYFMEISLGTNKKTFSEIAKEAGTTCILPTGVHAIPVTNEILQKVWDIILQNKDQINM